MLLERLLDNLSVRVEPFAWCDVASGWCLDLDDVGWVTLHFVLAGEGELVSPSKRVQPLRPATLAVVPARMPHRIRRGDGTEVAAADRVGAGEDSSGLVRFVAAPVAPGTRSVEANNLVIACGELQAVLASGLGLFDLLTEPVVVDLSDSDEMLATFGRILEESQRPTPGSRAMLIALMNACLVQLFRRLCDGPECSLPSLQALEDPRMAAVLEVLLEHPEHDHSLEALAAVATMSRSAFAAEFKACFGRTPMAFLRELRLRRGAQLLERTTLPVEAVARRVGFASRSHFSRAFQQQFGASPVGFRARA